MDWFVVYFLDRKKLKQAWEIYRDEAEARRDAADPEFRPGMDQATVWRYEMDEDGEIVPRGRTFVAAYERTGYGL